MLRLGRGGWLRWACTGVSACNIVAALAFSALSAQDQKPANSKSPAQTDAAKKKAKPGAPGQTTKNAGKTAKGGAQKVSRPARPQKKTTPPTLTPAALDLLIQKSIDEAKAPLAQQTNDAEFVRRVYLDVTGKPPTSEQIAAFFQGRGTTSKRAKLIDQLLASEDFARNWARYWCDVIQFHATNTGGNQVRYGALEDWLAEQFAKNTPWDEVAKTLITATGRNDEEGAVNFAISHSTDPVELAGEVSRIFLGIQIQCAQCHDHPTDRWKRQQFHEFAAFFAGTRTRKVDGTEKGNDVFEVVAPKGKPRYTMPDKADPHRQIPIQPKFFLAKATETPIAGLTTEEQRTLAASYVTGQDNPWFARAFVNRVWFALLGDGFYNPVDDMGQDRECHASAALDALASQWQEGGYDVRWLFRTILNTKAYQREVRATNSQAGRTPFASNCTMRLRADQIADALARALDVPIDGAPAKPSDANASKPAEPTKKAAMRPRNTPRAAIRDLFGVDPSTPVDQILGTIPQALYLMNSPQVNRAIRSGGNTPLAQILAGTPNNRVALEALYLRVLNRPPTNKEVEVCARYVDHVKNRREAFEDILWSLVNSTEFISRR